MRSRRLIVLALGCALLGAGVIWLARRPAFPPPLVLPSGDTVVLRAITYGTNHFGPVGPRWFRLLPAPLRRSLAARWPFLGSGPITTVEPAMLLWLEDQPPTNTAPLATQTSLMLADASGEVAGERLSVYFSGAPNASATVRFNAFPRRAPKITVLWVQGDYQHPHVVGRWTIPNPAPSSSPIVPADKLPTTCRDGDLECTLHRVASRLGGNMTQIAESGGTQRVEFGALNPGEEAHATTHLSFRERGTPTNTWTVDGLILTDTTGNHVTPDTTSIVIRDTSFFFTWSPVLWPTDTWEIRLSAKRGNDAAFASNELAEIKDLPVRDPGLTALWNQVLNIPGGGTVSLDEFTLQPPVPPGGAWSSSSMSQLKISVRNQTNLATDLILVTDEHGKAHHPNGWSSSSASPGSMDVTFHFTDLPADTRHLSLTFAVQRRRNFTFHVRPEVANTNISFR